MKLSLLVLAAGKAEGQIIPVNLAQFTIGRDPQCNLRPASALISKRHCAFLVRGDEAFVRDFDSTNGTFLNNTPVKGEVPIKNGDMVKVGPLEFKVSLEATKVVNAKPKPTPAPQAKDNSSALKATKAPSETTADDDIAAMLLSLPGEEMDSSKPADESGIPSGSTVMDLVVPKEGESSNAAAKAEQPAGSGTAATPASAPAKKEEKKSDPAHIAAKAILEKYARRGRA